MRSTKATPSFSLARATSRGLAITALLWALGATSGCNDNLEKIRANQPITNVTAENTILLCSDGVDNDNDGLIDCDDPDCLTMGTLEKPGPGRVVCATTEDTDILCSDGIDNDGNGFTDCDDFSCSRNPAVRVCGVCVPTVQQENTNELCSDGIDNDCDGYIDCQDNSCSRAYPDVTVCCTPTNVCVPKDDWQPNVCLPLQVGQTERFCSLILLGEADPCTSDDDCPQIADGTCHDTKIDCFINTCAPPAAGQTQRFCTETPTRACNNDDDCPSTECVIAENSEALCSDGIDNDCNGYADCRDNSCRGTGSTPARAVCRVCTPQPENTAAACSDGIDNDCDGYVDCDDWDCDPPRAQPELPTRPVAELCPTVICDGQCCPRGSQCIENNCVDPSCSTVRCGVNCCQEGKLCRNDTCVDACELNEDLCDDVCCTNGTACDPILRICLPACPDGRESCNGACCEAPRECGRHGCGSPFTWCQDKQPEPAEGNLVQKVLSCIDGIDNDRNGRTDCDDWGCWELHLELLEVNLEAHPDREFLQNLVPLCR